MNNSTKNEWSILVFSYDGASDLWPLFFYCLFKHLDDVKLPIYLLCNFRYFDDERVVSIRVGKDHNWGSNMKISLPQIPTKYILYLCEDYFITGKVDISKINDIVSFLESQNGIFVRMCQWGEEGTPVDFMGLYEISPKTKWMAHLQAGLWNKEKLLEMVVPGHDPWQAESHLNRIAKQIGRGYFSISRNTPPILPYFEGVRGGFWKPDAVKYFQQLGLLVDLKSRPCPPQGEEWFKKLYRSILKRKMSLARIKNNLLNKTDEKRLAVKPITQR